MDAKLRDGFVAQWRKYFGAAELPIALWYTDDDSCRALVEKPQAHACVVAQLSKARRGGAIAFDAGSVSCGGGKRYLGYTTKLAPGFEHFLSRGIPGKLEGERYKKTPELVVESLKSMGEFTAPAKYIVFKRWDALQGGDEPAVVVFFARPDVLSGLFTLANFDEAEQNGVFTPFSAGCGSIVEYPYLEIASKRPRCVIGTFDVSARPCVETDVLSFAAPFAKFTRMVANMDESFLITESWAKVRRRLA